jgi:hypothetical protein
VLDARSESSKIFATEIARNQEKAELAKSFAFLIKQPNY